MTYSGSHEILFFVILHCTLSFMSQNTFLFHHHFRQWRWQKILSPKLWLISWNCYLFNAKNQKSLCLFVWKEVFFRTPLTSERNQVHAPTCANLPDESWSHFCRSELRPSCRHFGGYESMMHPLWQNWGHHVATLAELRPSWSHFGRSDGYSSHSSRPADIWFPGLSLGPPCPIHWHFNSC